MNRKHWIYSAVFAAVFALIAVANIALADTTYVVARGDTLARIAGRFGTSVRAIADANNIINPNYIYVGQVLTIPDANGGNQPTPTPPPTSEQIYYVQYGDTLSKIAARFGITLSELAAYNGIVNPNWIYVGQAIRIPGSDPAPQPTDPPATSPPPQATPVPTEAPPTGEQSYVVRHGDTLGRIAARFGTTINAIAQRNGITNPNYIYIGQVLIIPGSGQPQPTTPPPTQTPAPLPTTVPTQAPTATATPTQLPPTLTPVPTEPSGNSDFGLGGQTHTLANPDLMKDVGMTWVKFQHKWSVGDGPGNVAGRISDAHSKGLESVDVDSRLRSLEYRLCCLH